MTSPHVIKLDDHFLSVSGMASRSYERLAFQTRETLDQYKAENAEFFGERHHLLKDLETMAAAGLVAFADYLVDSVDATLVRARAIDAWRSYHRDSSVAKPSPAATSPPRIFMRRLEHEGGADVEDGFSAAQDDASFSWLVLAQVVLTEDTDVEEASRFDISAHNVTVEDVHFWQRDPCFIFADLFVQFALASFSILWQPLVRRQASHLGPELTAALELYYGQMSSLSRLVDTLVSKQGTLWSHHRIDAPSPPSDDDEYNDNGIGQRILAVLPFGQQVRPLQRAYLNRLYRSRPYALISLYLVYSIVDEFLHSSAGRQWEILAFSTLPRIPRLGTGALPRVIVETPPASIATPDKFNLALGGNGRLTAPFVPTEWTSICTPEELRTIWFRSPVPLGVIRVFDAHAERLTLDVGGLVRTLVAGLNPDS